MQRHDKSRTEVFWYDYEKARRLKARFQKYQVQVFTAKGPDIFGFGSFKEAVEASLKYQFSKIFRGNDCLAIQKAGQFKTQGAIKRIDVLGLKEAQ